MLNNQENIYYVYKHTFPNGTCYIGKGKGNRAYRLYGRNCFWTSLYLKYGQPIIEIIMDNLSEDN